MPKAPFSSGHQLALWSFLAVQADTQRPVPLSLPRVTRGKWNHSLRILVVPVEQQPCMNGELLHVQELKMSLISPQETELHLSHSDSPAALMEVSEEGALGFQTSLWCWVMAMRSICFWDESKLSAGAEAKAHEAAGVLSARRTLCRNKAQHCPAAVTHPSICTSHILTEVTGTVPGASSAPRLGGSHSQGCVLLPPVCDGGAGAGIPAS